MAAYLNRFQAYGVRVRGSGQTLVVRKGPVARFYVGE